MRQTVMGIIVMAASFTLPHPFMQAIQFVAGAALFGLGLYRMTCKEGR